MIDLSDETDGTSNLMKRTAPSTLSLFDALLSQSSTSYGQDGLHKPLIQDGSTPSDPFDLNPSIKSMFVTKSESGSPYRSTKQPVIYSRPQPQSINQKINNEFTESVASSHNNQNSDNNIKPSKLVVHPGSKFRSLPTNFESLPNRQKIPEQIKNDLDRSELPFVPKKTVNLTNDSSDQPSSANSSGLVAKTNFHHMPDDQVKANKAFDWLNDAISNFAMSRSSEPGTPDHLDKPCGIPQYDEVPVEEGTDVIDGKPVYCNGPRYDQVPIENDPRDIRLPVSKRTVLSLNQGPRYDEVPTEYDQSDIKLPQQKQIYAPQSVFSDDASWDSFDSDFDDADDNEEKFAVSAPVTIEKSPSREPPPPLPPRDYLSSSLDSGRGTFNKNPKPRINPIVQDGHQLSQTHYFLIPPKNEQQCHSPNTAQVKPFSVDGNQLHNPINRSSSGLEYQNLSSIDSTSKRLSSASDDLSWTGMTGFKPVGTDSSSNTSSYERKYSKKHNTYTAPVKSPSRPITTYKKSSTVQPAFTSSSPREHVAKVMSSVIGVTDDECHAALCHCHWDTDQAIKYLKIEQLFRMGITTREHCQKLLETLHWNLELASSVMIDEFKSTKTSMESTV